MLKNNKGITLIALVITIIVLLILAGVSIAMLTGNNGVLTRASSAKVSNRLGEMKDEISLLAAETMTDYYQETYVNSTLANSVFKGNELDNDIVAAINEKASITDPAGTGTYDGVSVTTTAYVPPANEGAKPTYATVKLSYQGYKTTGTITSGKIKWDPIEKGN